MVRGILKKFIKNTNLSSDYLSPEGNLSIIYNLERHGQLENALQQIENLEFDLIFDSQVTKCRLLMCSGKLDESLSLSEDILPQIIEQEKTELELLLKSIEGFNHYYLKDLESVNEIISNLQPMINNFTDQELEKFQKSIAWYFLLHGYYLEAKGDLNESLEFLEQSLHLLKNQGYLYYESVILGHIGRIYSSKGELGKAMDNFIHELEIAKRTKEFNRIARATLNIASLNWRKNRIEKAYALYKESLEFSIESGNNLYIAETLFDLILISLENVMESKANYYMSELEKYTKSSTNLEELIRCQIAKAMILMSSTRMINRAKAQEILTIAVNSDMVSQQLTIFAIQNLCVLLLEELQLYGDSEVLFEINALLESLSNIAKKQGSYVLDIEVLLLQAKVALLEGMTEKTVKYIKEAKDIAKNKHLDYLINKIDEIDKSMSDDIHKWMLVFGSDSSLRDRVEKSKINEYLKDAIKLKNFLKDTSGSYS